MGSFLAARISKNLGSVKAPNAIIVTFIYFFILAVCNTYEDFPLPVGPRIALRPGLIMPLKNKHLDDLAAFHSNV